MRRLLCLLLLVELLGGCSRCARSAPTPPTSIRRFLPRVAEAVVVVPNAARLGAKLKQLERLKLASFLASLQGFPSAEAWVSGAMEQLGVDLRSPDELAKAGIDSERGAAVAIVSANRGYSVIAIADLARFRDALRRLANNRLGATSDTTREELGHAVTYFARPDAGPVLAFVAVDGFALLAAGDSVSELPGYASLSLPESLADAQSLGAALGRLPASPDLYVHIPTTSNLAGHCGLANCTFSAELTPEALLLRGDLPRPRSARTLAALAEKSAPDLLGLLPPDAFFVARFSGDPLLLTPLWQRLVGAQAANAIEQSDFNIERELLSNIEPGAVASISLAPTATFSEMPSLDVRRTNPFRFAHLVALAAVKDARRADEMLDKLPDLAPRLGAKVESAQRQGRKVFVTSYAQGQGASFAQVDGKLMIAAPVQRLDETIARLGRPGGSGPIADSDLRNALKGRAVAAVLDFPALAQSIRNLPSSAWGIGGFAIKATTVRWLDAIDDLRAVTAVAYAKEDALQVELDLRFVKR